MINFDGIIKENIKEHNPYWPQLPGRLHIIIITGGSGPGKQMHYLI